MKTILSSETMDIPDGIEIKIKAKIIEVKGPRGTLTRNFKHLNLDFMLITDEETGKKKLKVDAWFGSRKTTAAIRTALSHVGNLITGVTQGFRYKMRFVYAHFPINASISNTNSAIEIRNFLGEKKVCIPFYLFVIMFIVFLTLHIMIDYLHKLLHTVRFDFRCIFSRFELIFLFDLYILSICVVMYVII